MGTWKLNESKSKYAPGSDKNTTITYTAAKGDMIKCTADGVEKDGRPIHWTWTGKLDGKPYLIKGSPNFDTLAYHPMNERTNKTTARKNGKVVMTAVIGQGRQITDGDADRHGSGRQEVHEQDQLRQGVRRAKERLKS